MMWVMPVLGSIRPVFGRGSVRVSAASDGGFPRVVASLPVSRQWSSWLLGSGRGKGKDEDLG
jgi:hypothetical protein